MELKDSLVSNYLALVLRAKLTHLVLHNNYLDSPPIEEYFELIRTEAIDKETFMKIIRTFYVNCEYETEIEWEDEEETELRIVATAESGEEIIFARFEEDRTVVVTVESDYVVPYSGFKPPDP